MNAYTLDGRSLAMMMLMWCPLRTYAREEDSAFLFAFNLVNHRNNNDDDDDGLYIRLYTRMYVEEYYK